MTEAVDAWLPHGRRTRSYAGFTLVYSRGNSLVERIERRGGYETATIEAITRELAAAESKVLVDVGANIGLVALGVLAAVPEAVVYAFEPGPHQHALLAETIRLNRLESRLELSRAALADTKGVAAFAVHSSRHAAGDGFRDTGRSGRARTVDVETETLDGWWESAGRPHVSVVKLDTEGSELMILRGASSLLAQCRPTLFLEIHDVNLRVYPYDGAEVHRYVESLGYAVESLGRAEVVARAR